MVQFHPQVSVARGRTGVLLGASPGGNQQQGLRVLPEHVAVLCRCKPLKQDSKSCGLFIFGMFFWELSTASGLIS